MPEAAKVGAVLRAEAETSVDGLEVTAVSLPRERPDPGDRLELIGTRRGPMVTTTLFDKRGGARGRAGGGRDGGKRRRGRDKGRRRKGGPDGGRRRRDDRSHRRGRGQGDRSRSGAGRADRPENDRRSKKGKPRRDDRRGRHRGGDRDDARRRGRGPRDRRDRRGRRDDRKRRSARNDRQRRQPRPSAFPRAPRLKPKRVHRTAALKALPEEQLPLAREVLRAGMPGLRKTVSRMNQQAAAEKLPLIETEPLLALAAKLAPRLKSAEWRDRAEAALDAIDVVDLRDIRSVVVAADQGARTKEAKALARSLRSGLADRLESDQRKWLAELAATIGEGRTIRALRLSSRPPKAGVPLSPDIAERLAELASSSLSNDVAQQRWTTVLDAVAYSPVRMHVSPAGLPDDPGEELLLKVKRVASRVPHISALFGIGSKPRRRRPPPPPPPAQNEAPASSGSASSGSVSPGSVSPGSASPGSASPDSASSDSASSGSVSPGSVSPGSVSPGSASSGSASPDSSGKAAP